MSGAREPFAMIPFSLLECCHDPFAIHLYAWLRRHANREGLASCESGRLARAIGASPRSLKRALVRLRAAGFVRTKLRHRADGSVAGLTFTVFESAQTASGGGKDQRAISGLKVKSGLKANFRPPKGPNVAPLKEIDLLDLDLKALKQAAPVPPTLPEQKSAPTGAHVTLFVAELAKRWSYDYDGGNADLMEDLKNLFVERNFDYEAVPRSLPGWFNSACVQVGAARGRKAR